MFRTGVLAVAATTILATNVHDREVYESRFFEHMKKFNLKFSNGEEFVRRLQVFSDNLDMIEAHNADKTQTYTMGLNQFSHLTLSEFHDLVHLGGTRPPYLRSEPSARIHEAPANAADLPESVDWVAAGVVGDVKNQGSCGSCWAFSAVGALESAYALKYGKSKVFSEQQVVSCDKNDSGCNGGWMDTAFDWVKQNGGLALGSDYQYTSGTSGSTGTCKTGFALDPLVAPSNYTDVQTKSVTALMSAVAQQPVSIAIQANQIAFQSYSGGVLTGRCGNRLDHGVILVGYGTLDGIDYWKVRNSWGPSWGLDGYILIERSAADLCGVLDAPSYPNL